MKKTVIIIIGALAVITACTGTGKNEKTKKMSETIDKTEALQIAEEDAKTVYDDLTIYRVEITREGDNWKVDYELSDPEMNGGGPHYLISAKTGEIVDSRYEQ